MKSITERKKEREAKERRQRMKRSVGCSGIYRRFNIPAYRLGWTASEGDLAFLKKKAENLLKACRNWAPHQFARYIKEIILEEERVRLEEKKKRDDLWNARPSKDANSGTPVAVLPIVPVFVRHRAAVSVGGEGSTQVVTNAVPAPLPVVDSSDEETSDWANVDFSIH